MATGSVAAFGAGSGVASAGGASPTGLVEAASVGTEAALGAGAGAAVRALVFDPRRLAGGGGAGGDGALA